MGCGSSSAANGGPHSPSSKRHPKDRSQCKTTTQKGAERREQNEVDIDLLLRGYTENECLATTKIVRIFTSSTFTDTRHERNALMERVYPKLRSYCQERGYQFQVVDMRWGISDESTNDHMTTELCLQEIQNCQQLSTGPNFVTFLSHKYGYRPIPRIIEAAEFEVLLSCVTDRAAIDVLQKWYKKDENAVSPAYTLVPISTHLPAFLEKENKDTFNEAKSSWWKEHDVMQAALVAAAANQDYNISQKYTQSVTETEIHLGILNSETKDTSTMWFQRNITDIGDIFVDLCKQSKNDSEIVAKRRLLSRYMDYNASPESSNEVHGLLNRLKEEMKANIPESKVYKYDVKWTDRAIDPDTCKEHKEYINTMRADFENVMKEQIEEGIERKESSGTKNPLLEEVMQHTSFCQNKCKLFYGRKETLEKLKDYTTNNTKLPCVIHGTSGSGKTSL